VLPGTVLAALPLFRSIGFGSISSAPDSIYERASQLSNRERSILASMAGFERLDEHAAALFLSRNTLKAHYRSIYTKLGVATRAGAIDFAERAGFSLLDSAM
jgi:LuxR family transcriptional regulator of spore coat protein